MTLNINNKKDEINLFHLEILPHNKSLIALAREFAPDLVLFVCQDLLCRTRRRNS
jgi:hypothetical protein